MICYDAENPEFVSDALAEEPVLMLNPIHISAGALSGAGGRDLEKQRRMRWRTSLESMGRHVDHLVHKSGVTWVRCDQPFPCGAGTSQVTSSACTQQVPDKGTTNWSVFVTLKGSDHNWVVRPPPRDRTAEIDNCGNRYTLKSCMIPSTGVNSNIDFDFVKPFGEFHRGFVRMLSDAHVVATVDLFRMMSVPSSSVGLESIKQGEEVAGIAGVTSCGRLAIGNKGFFVELDGCRMRLMYRKSEESAGCRLTQDTSSVLECHHVFVGPSSKIEAVAYQEDLGVLFTLSRVRGRAALRTDLLQVIDGVHDKNQSGGSSMIFTVWEFMQHRHPVALHKLLQ